MKPFNIKDKNVLMWKDLKNIINWVGGAKYKIVYD